MTSHSLNMVLGVPGDPPAQPELLFTSPYRSIRARGIQARVDTPALDGEAFQRAIEEALAHARAAGQQDPIVMGAIPFDISQPSYLYVPEQHEYVSRDEVLAAGRRGALCPRVLSARNIPDEQSFKMGVRQAIANFQHSCIRKAVLSRKYEIHLSEPLDTGCVLGNLVAQNPSAYHFRLPMEDGCELIGASPELLLRKEGARIQTFPLAGSARRQADPEADRQTADALQCSTKDHYEHRVVVDDIRQVLAPLCTRLQIPGAPELVSTATMWHLGTPIDGQLADPHLPALQLACRLHPTPAVCGFPAPSGPQTGGSDRALRAGSVHRHRGLVRCTGQWRVGGDHPLRHSHEIPAVPVCRGGDRRSLLPRCGMGRDPGQDGHHAERFRAGT